MPSPLVTKPKPVRVAIANSFEAAVGATFGVACAFVVVSLLVTWLASGKSFDGSRVRSICAAHEGVRNVRRTSSVFEKGTVGVVCLDGWYQVVDP